MNITKIYSNKKAKSTTTESNVPTTAEAIATFQAGDSYESYIGGFTVKSNFDKTESVPTDVLDFGTNEDGNQITKTWEEAFLFFEYENQEYVYAMKMVDNGIVTNYIDLPGANLLAMAQVFGESAAIAEEDFNIIYRAYNASLVTDDE